jgi:hypothetical protein
MNDAPPYIQKAVDYVLKAIESGNKRILLSLPLGKVTAIEQILHAYYPPEVIYTKKILIVTDRRGFVDQFRMRLAALYKNVSSIKGRWPIDDPIIVTTAQSFITADSVSRFNGLEFDLIFLLGLGLSSEGRYKKNIHDYFNKAIIIGIDNGFEKPSEFFGEAVFRYSFKDAINDAYLVPFKVTRVTGILDVRFKDELELDFEYEEINRRSFIPRESIKLVAKSLLEQINDEKTIVYCNSQEEAQLLSELLNSMVNKSFSFAAISNMIKVPEVITRYRRDETPVVLTTVNMLTTGFDLPNVKNIVLLRYIKSASLLGQMLAKGLRPYKGKEYLHVYDYVGVFDQMNILDAFITPGSANELADEVPGDNAPASNNARVDNPFSKTRITFRDRKHINGVLGVKEIAEELAEVIKILPGERGSMIGIFGKWGRGKTFLMEEVSYKLEDGNNVERVDFHAWRYQDTPASWAYLYEVLSQKYIAASNKAKAVRWAIRLWRVIKLNFKRNGIFPVLKFLITVGFVIAIGFQLYYFSLSQPKEVKNIVNIFGLTFSVAALNKLFSYLKDKYSSAASELFLKYSKKHSFKEHLGLQAEIQKELIALLKTWIPEKHTAAKKIIIFVDDIDRCNEHKIIQLIDSLRVMLEDDDVAKRVVVITAIDERILKYAIRSKYHTLVKEGEALNINTLTKEYFDKLFIIGIKLGDLSSQERDEFFIEFIKNDINGPVGEILGPGAYAGDEMWLNENGEQSELPSVPTKEIAPNNVERKPGTETVVSVTEKKEETTRVDKLLPEEISRLRTCLKTYDNATPRQIRIFYYRFLMAKNLLIKQYSLLARDNIWLTHQYSHIFVNLIVVYSRQEDALLISQHKVSILHTSEPEVKVFLLDDISVPTADYGELLKALDIVLAY